jgi:hypothetical protein
MRGAIPPFHHAPSGRGSEFSTTTAGTFNRKKKNTMALFELANLFAAVHMLVRDQNTLV